MGVQSSFGFTLGRMEKGRLNKITDVPGVRVGHVTRHEGGINTGVTAILPHTGDMFHDKCPAASHVINGFGKSIGLVQVNELGTIETPIALDQHPFRGHGGYGAGEIYAGAQRGHRLRHRHGQPNGI